MSSFSLEGKVAVITGGSRGIGKSISSRFAHHGAVVHILDVDDESGTELAKKLSERGSKVYFHHADVTDQPAILDLFEKIYQTDQRLDILVNNAGIAHIGNLENTTEEDFDRIYSVNVKGVYNCSHAAIGYLKKQGGSILNMASVAASLGIADRFAYSMSKGAVLTMTYSIAKDYLDDNIRCNSISPGRVHTPFVDGYLKINFPGREEEMFEKLSKTQPIGRMGKPDEIAALALYLCSDEAAFITGTDYPIDGGFIRLNS
jgi:2-keto-3-deoxy-L-fuconate dehydrogenase